ncbi:MAG TPA: carotenoid biosynthesis protein [Xanthomonadales bacterium]|nr:carotenoid biosynthesis protein [Xanthomonadales bacterium]
MKRVAWAFTGLHAFALVVGLFGILIAIPHLELWAGKPGAAAFFAFAIDKTGGAAMFLGALAMLAFGVYALGVRRTLIFFFAATIISATAELTGTKTGWPFGGYEYTDFLGPKLLGRVPVAVPLSWFYMGFASFVLADSVVARRGWRHRTLWSVVLGTWLLTAWDLVLDPSMAAPQMQYIHFWIWHESGPYFGMPLRNLAGWFGTGLLFVAAGRMLWRERVAPAAPVMLPFAVYAVNVAWSMVLSVSAGMWPTALAAIVLALLPAAFALGRSRSAAAYA